MDQASVLARLRQHESELKAAGIVGLSLFGSVARGEQRPDSDVDLMAEFEASRQFSILEMVHLENRLADILGASVDLAPARSMREPVRERAMREAVVAF